MVEANQELRPFARQYGTNRPLLACHEAAMMVERGIDRRLNKEATPH
jgi:hypothetical protein